MWPTEYSFILSSITPAVNDPEDLGSCALPTLILFSSDIGYAAYLPSSIPQPYSQSLSILTTDSLVLLSGGSGLLGLVATELLLRLGLDGLVGSLDSGNTLDSSGAEVSTVAVFGGLVGNSLEGLAVALGAAVGGVDKVLGGLVGLGLLGGDNNSTLLAGGDTEGLVVDETGVLAGGLVGQVEGVSGELNTAVLLALGREAVVVTDDLPDQVRGNVGELLSGRHCD